MGSGSERKQISGGVAMQQATQTKTLTCDWCDYRGPVDSFMWYARPAKNKQRPPVGKCPHCKQIASSPELSEGENGNNHSR
jgi:hypothetical protein